MAIVTISGNLGAGKTTLAGNLANALGYDELYVGSLMRKMAPERGVSIEDFYAQLKNDPALEKSVDERQAKLMREKDNLVIQGRVAWFFAKQSPFKVFNIFLAVSPEVGAKRTSQRKENAGRTINEMVVANAFRAKLEMERYRTLYGIENFLDPSHYDMILDTTNLTEQEVLENILSKIKSIA